MKECKQCKTQFEVTDEDRKFYEKMDVSEPTMCPNCRQQRRAAFRNERNLYKRKSDLSGKDIISNISSDKSHKVYHSKEWWSDKWDPLEYGQIYSFEKPFFKQFTELIKAVPRINLFYYFSENCDYTNHAYHNKNCYMLFNAAYCENVYFSSNLMYRCSNCADCMTAEKAELLYECLFTKDCFNSNHLIHCNNCSDSSFLYDCHSCKHCFMCWNLRNKEYYFMNEKLTKEEYSEKIKSINLGNFQELKKYKNEFSENMKHKAIHRNFHIENSENCTGDYIFNSKNTKNTYYADKCEDINHCYDALENKDCMDTYESSIKVELQYECYGCNESSNCRFCIITQSSHDMTYCDFCFNCQNCFGCSGLRNKKYCILNKQYTKEEYELLIPKIVEHMKEAREWSEFFPIGTYPFAYNESIAQEFYPIAESEASKNGWKWIKIKDEIPHVEKIIPANRLPDDIKNVPDDILNWAVECEKGRRPFKITPQELKFYRENNFPIPHLHPDERHKERTNVKNIRQLFARKCTKCSSDIQTTYDPKRPETLYCEDCYLKEVY